MSKSNVILISSIILVLYSVDVAGDFIDTMTDRLRALFSKLDKNSGNAHLLTLFNGCLEMKLSQTISRLDEIDEKEKGFLRCINVTVGSFLGNPNSAVQNLKKLFKQYGIIESNMERQGTNETELYSLDVAGDVSATTGRLRALFSKLDNENGSYILTMFNECLKMKLSQLISEQERLFHCINFAVTSCLGNYTSAVPNMEELFKKLDSDFSPNRNTYGVFDSEMDYMLRNESNFAKFCRSISVAITAFGV